ncbi:MAG TPA: hypothetical protein VL442_06820 [Mucilaginibacter sp.]|jgi:hypothetical protein|nr:hypothetical protein [Mucilaginibacter sp.]
MKYIEPEVGVASIRRAKQELEFIQLGIKNHHVDHFRHFIDQYYCFKNGYVNKNGGAAWGKIIFKEWVSNNAIGLIKKKVVHKEHVVPLKVLKVILMKLKNPSLEEIEKTLDSNLFYATITKEEDKLLRNAGLNSKMPEEYYDVNSVVFQDPFARYKKVGIELHKLNQ